MSRLVFILLFVLCCLCPPCSAAVPTYVDTTHCEIKHFNEKHLSSYRSSRDFDYETEPAKGGGFFSLISYLYNDMVDRLSEAHVGSISLLDILFYTLALFAAGMIIYHFFKAEITGLFTGTSTNIVTHQSYTENVHELDFETMIQNALTGGDYRLATRLYYLSILKKLSEAGLINWQKNKTNFEYYYELKGEDRRKQFYNLTRIFESVWYGKHEITGNVFDENLKAFTGFLQTIKR
jgi:hypothetical protein